MRTNLGNGRVKGLGRKTGQDEGLWKAGVCGQETAQHGCVFSPAPRSQRGRQRVEGVGVTQRWWFARPISRCRTAHRLKDMCVIDWGAQEPKLLKERTGV